MLPSFKRGNIIVPLIILFGVSSGVLALVKFLSSSQTDVSAAIDGRYSTQMELAAKLDTPEKWETYTNSLYKFKFKYPKQWPGLIIKENQNDSLFMYERFLSHKINLKLEIKKFFEATSPGARSAIFNKNKFEYEKVDDDTLRASIQKNSYYYIFTFKNDGYFMENSTFWGVFYNLLKNFEFLN